MERREPTEHQSAQQQAQLFEKSLPKVNQLAFNMLLNELVPLSMAVENDIHDMAVKDSNAEDVTVEVLAGDVDKKVVLRMMIQKRKKNRLQSIRLVSKAINSYSRYITWMMSIGAIV